MKRVLVVTLVVVCLFALGIAMASAVSMPEIDRANASGELFRIRGHCQSNCTLFLGLRNVCVERSATLLFHAGHDRQRNINAGSTQRMLSAYNAKLRKYVLDNHYMDTLEFHTIPGSMIIDRFGYRECPRQ